MQTRTNYGVAFSFSFITPLDSLPNGNSAVTTTVGNDTIGDYMFMDMQLKFTTTTVDNKGFVTVYLLRTIDGVTFDDISGNAQILGRFNTNVASTTYVQSLDTAKIGVMPWRFRVAVKNDSGGTSNSTASNHHLYFRGKKMETAP
jgi:hypothetical protein